MFGPYTSAPETSAMSSRKSRPLARHCSIMRWLEPKDPDFAQALHDLCLAGQLSARPNSSGVTLLYPPKEVRSNIAKLAQGDKAEEAIAMIEAHIVPAAMRAASDFTDKVGTKGGFLLGVAKAGGKTVTLENGAVLEAAADFKPIRRDNIAVWEVKKGEVPLTGAKFDPASLRRKTGGGPGGGQIRVRAIQEAAAEARAGGGGKSFLCRVVGLLVCLKDKFPDDYARALCALDRSPYCLFILLEPYRSGDFYLSEAAVEAWGGVPADGSCAEALLGVFQDLAEACRRGCPDACSAEAFADPKKVCGAARKAAEKLLNESSATTARAVIECYDHCVGSNSVGHVSGVWPECVVSRLQGGRKLWQDLFRYSLRLVQNELADPTSDRAEVLKTLRQLTDENFCGKDFAGEVKNYWGLDDRGITHAGGQAVALMFLNSDDFLYVPCPTRALVELVKVGGGPGDPDSNPLQSPSWKGQMVSHNILERHATRRGAALDASSLLR